MHNCIIDYNNVYDNLCFLYFFIIDNKLLMKCIIHLDGLFIISISIIIIIMSYSLCIMNMITIVILREVIS